MLKANNYINTLRAGNISICMETDVQVQITPTPVHNTTAHCTTHMTSTCLLHIITFSRAN